MDNTIEKAALVQLAALPAPTEDGTPTGFILNTYLKAKDRRVFLHMVNLFNSGAFTLPGLAKPLNECTMEEVLLGEQLEEQQYWKEQQRQGNFIALTRENILAPSADKPENELTLADFMQPAKALAKAHLIVFEGRDGHRYVLKDINNVAQAEK